MARSNVDEALIPGILRERKRAAKRLARARAASGLSLDEVALLSGIHRSRWVRFETGQTPIPLELVPLMARAVDTSTIKLLAA